MKSKFFLRMRHLLALPILLFLMTIGMAGRAQTVTLDQADLDYAPGETVYITGNEFLPGEIVTMTISHIEPGLPLVYHEHAVFYATTDSIGTFNASWYVEEVELNTTMSLLAEGDQGSLASVVFTDANPFLVSISAGAQSGTLTYGTSGSATFAMTATLSGTGNKPRVTYTVKSGLPAGATAPNVSSSNGSSDATLTVNTSATTPAGTYTLTIQGNEGIHQAITTATLIVGKRSLDFSGTKTYDAGATFTADQLTAGNVVNSDVIGLAGSASVSSKNVGSSSSFSSNSLTTTNANYQVTGGAINVSITAKALTVQNAAASSKVYDHINTAIINGTLNGIISPDDVTLNGTGTFASVNVANNIVVTSTSTLAGAQAGNYSLTQPTGLTANITAKALTVSGATASNKVYDGTNTASVSGVSLLGVIAPDAVTLIPSGIFASVNAANDIVVTSISTLGGAQAGNYSLTQPTGLTANITPKTLMITGVTANTKVYDATTSAVVNTDAAVLSGLVSGDDVSLDVGSVSGVFVSKTVGISKTVSLSGFEISGLAAGNYTLTQPSATANITALPITGSITANSKVYDGNGSATIVTRILNGVIAPDAVSYTGGTATFADKNVGSGKTVTATGLSLSGTDAGNYSVNTTANTTADITAKPLSITGTTASNKVYDGNALATLNTSAAALSGLVSGDVVILNKASATGSFADKNTGTGKTVTTTGFTTTGNDAGNYSLAQPVTTANITPKTLTITGVTANNKVYDGTTSVTLNTTSASLSGVVLGDEVILNSVNGTGTFANAGVGSNKSITASGFTISGMDAGNYSLTQPTGLTANITQKPLTISGVSANNKVYNGTTVATLNTTSAALVGAIAGDNVTLNSTGASALFADQNVGSDKSVTATGFILGGNDKTNYTLSQPSGLTANITARPITITADAKSKIYGDTDPLLTYQITLGNLVLTDAFTGSLTREAGEDVGNYEIGQGTVALNSNYTLSYVPANLSITQRPITITADAKSKTYGDIDPFLTAQATNTVEGDTPSGSLSRAAGENVGSYTINKSTYTYGSNYAETFVGTNLVINQRHISIEADAQSKFYGETDPALTFHITNGTLAFTDGFTGSLTRNAGEDVGAYAILQGTVELSSNYDLSYVAADLSITKRPVTITADVKTKVYGEADPALTYRITSGSLAFTDAFTGVLTRDAGEDVGDFAIIQGSVALSNNYTLTYVGANLSITSRPVTITADAQSKIYGDTDPALTYRVTLGSLAFSDGFTGNLTRDAGENVGSYAITQGSVALNSNYDLSYVGAMLTIDKREVTITADAKTKVYGEADPALTYQITSGSLAFTDVFAGALTRDAGEDVGSYAINQGSVALTDNYTLSYLPANLSITKRAVTITADGKTKVYGDADPALTYEITSGSLAFSDGFTGALTRDAGEDVGDYAITQGSVALNSNYTLSYVTANFTIKKREVTITADAKSKVYGDADPALTYQITSGSLAFTDQFVGTLTRDPGETVGDYAINQGSVALNSNYDLSYIGDKLTINKRAVTITADAKTKVYGNADPALTYQITSGSLAFSDAFTGLLARETGENVGDYEIGQGTVALNSNYILSYVPASLTITKRAVTITADAKTKVYGNADPALTYQITSGTLAFTDAFTGALTRDAGKDVGNYAITLGTVALNTNYTLSYIGANLGITSRPVTITADAKDKTYGNADPALTYQITSGSLAFSDVFTGVLTRDAGEDVGSYPITQGTVALNSNYSLTYLGANLTIGKRSVQITADAKNKTYGDADPALTYQITSGSLAFTDQFVGTLTRDPGQDVGSYAINQGSVALNSNYTLTYVGANLIINKRLVTITADAKSKYISQVDPALTYQITSGSLVYNDQFSGSLLRAAGECVGTYAISQNSVALNSNYTLTYVGANFTINGVSIDASQSSTPIPMGGTATLYAKVTPAAPGVSITFVLDNGTNTIGNPVTVTTNSSGIASTIVGILPVEVYKVDASIRVCTTTNISSVAYLAVYDPTGGFVTGGGWITSPAGAYTANPALTGKANFGFNSKYEKGKTTPTGNTEFQFQTGNLNFSSSTYNVGSLVIAGAKATYKGVGTINGSGNYAFMVSSVDGDVTGGGGIDKFRIKIWDANRTIYDNNMGIDENDLPTTALGGGSIVIHEVKNKSAEILPDPSNSAFEPTLKVYPNPFTERLNIEFSYPTNTRARLEIYNITGAKLETLYDGPVTRGELYTFEYLPRLVSSQVIFYHLTLDGKTQVGKILFNEKR